MRHSFWWLLGQFAIVLAAGTVIIVGVVALWYGLSFVVLATVGRLFPLRGGTWTPTDYDPTGGPRWALRPGRWTMTREEVERARARLSARERGEREATCTAHGHAWTGDDPNETQYCGRCFSAREG